MSRHEEAERVVAIAREAWPLRGGNGRDGLTTTQRFFNKVVTGLYDCWYWRGSENRLGYGCMSALGESKAHRVAWRLFYGDIPEGMSVLHKCDVRRCVNPEHLFLGTQSDNVHDMIAKGRGVSTPRCGEDNPAAKLTAEKVRQMREERSTGKSYKRIASEFGVSTMTAYRAVIGESWGKV